MLDETGNLAAAVTAILAGASGAGVDPRAVISLRAAITALDPAGGPPGHQAGACGTRRAGTAPTASSWKRSATPKIRSATGSVTSDQLQEQVIAALDQAHADLERAQRDLEAARQDLAAALVDAHEGQSATAATRARPPRSPPPRQPSPTRRNASRTPTRRISICQDTAEILDPLARRLQAALQALRQVPHDLGEVYELVYAFIRRGGKMPRFGRWIEGATQA